MAACCLWTQGLVYIFLAICQPFTKEKGKAHHGSRGGAWLWSDELF